MHCAVQVTMIHLSILVRTNYFRWIVITINQLIARVVTDHEDFDQSTFNNFSAKNKFIWHETNENAFQMIFETTRAIMTRAIIWIILENSVHLIGTRRYNFERLARGYNFERLFKYIHLVIFCMHFKCIHLYYFSVTSYWIIASAASNWNTAPLG